MKILLCVPCFLAILCAPGVLEASGCQTLEFDPETRLLKKEIAAELEPGDLVLYSDRTFAGSFTVPRKFGSTTMAVKGVACDQTGTPLSTLPLRLVRYEGELPLEDGDKPPSHEHFDNEILTIVEEVELTVSRSGGFSINGIGPGKYAFLVDWSGLSAEDVRFVLLDLTRTYGFTTLPVYTPAAHTPKSEGRPVPSVESLE